MVWSQCFDAFKFQILPTKYSTSYLSNYIYFFPVKWKEYMRVQKLQNSVDAQSSGSSRDMVATIWCFTTYSPQGVSYWNVSFILFCFSFDSEPIQFNYCLEWQLAGLIKSINCFVLFSFCKVFYISEEWIVIFFYLRK